MGTHRSKEIHGVSLPSDVLIMIFEDVNDMSPHNFSRLRLISKQCNALVVPILYRHLVLTEGIVACFGRDIDDDAQLQVARDVRRHTKGIGIDAHKLTWPLVGRLLGSLRDPRCLRHNSKLHNGTSCIFKALAMRWPNAKLALAASTSTITNALESPLLQLASCKILDNSKARYLGRTSVEESVDRLLEASSNLQRLYPKATLTHVNSLIPAFQELVLDKYLWTAGKALHWNFSNLTHLGLKRMIIRRFLEVIGRAQLPQLRSFKTDTCARYDCGTKFFCSWIRELSDLETLEFRCNARIADYLNVIKKHALTLQTLDLGYDSTCDIGSHKTWYWQLANALLTMSEPSLRLRQLTIGIGSSSVLDDGDLALSTPGAKNILAVFRDLRYLTVVVLQPYLTGVQPNRERDRSTKKAARAWIEGLVATKIGVQFEEVTIKILRATTFRPYLREKDSVPHSTYTYKGGRQEDDTLSIREDIHEQIQQYAEVWSHPESSLLRRSFPPLTRLNSVTPS